MKRLALFILAPLTLTLSCSSDDSSNNNGSSGGSTSSGGSISTGGTSTTGGATTTGGAATTGGSAGAAGAAPVDFECPTALPSTGDSCTKPNAACEAGSNLCLCLQGSWLCSDTEDCPDMPPANQEACADDEGLVCRFDDVGCACTSPSAQANASWRCRNIPAGGMVGAGGAGGGNGAGNGGAAGGNP